MYYVYLIKSIEKNYLYIGSTEDLKRRFDEHNSGTQKATKMYAPFRLIYYESYASKTDALIREKALKHHGSVVGHLKKRVTNSLKMVPKGRGGRRG
ncbi:MAG: GIY-YIG nuclease family protein [Parcubacteria group bacterium]|nr:GIY-YIG nuclease family protein [Parcubacteria group bacterium]MBI3075262.1 GIY-YIG nuclease family protein [Parcubacteria group bacterium]